MISRQVTLPCCGKGPAGSCWRPEGTLIVLSALVASRRDHACIYRDLVQCFNSCPIGRLYAVFMFVAKYNIPLYLLRITRLSK
jgi:hypothetical protein